MTAEQSAKAMRLRHPASLANRELSSIPIRDPGPGEIQVRIWAASFNFRDHLVANGFFKISRRTHSSVRRRRRGRGGAHKPN